MADRAAEQVRREFGLTMIVARYVDLYANLLNCSTPDRSWADPALHR
jgi:hypothetical protein